MTRARRLQWLTAAAIALLVILLVSATLAGRQAIANQREAARQQELAARQQELAEIRRMANQSALSFEQRSLVESVSLATEAARRADSLGEQVLEADSALRTSIALLPRSRGAVDACGTADENPLPFKVPLEERSAVSSHRSTPDGRYVAVAVDHYANWIQRNGQLYEGSVELWDALAKRRIVKFDELGLWQVSVAISANGKHLAAAGFAFGPRGNLIGRVLVWTAKEGKWGAVRSDSFEELTQDETIRSIAVSNDGRSVATNAFETALLWRHSMGRYQLAGRIPLGSDIADVVFSAGGDALLTRTVGSERCESWDLTGYRERPIAKMPAADFQQTSAEANGDPESAPPEIRNLENLRSFKSSGRYTAILIQEGDDDAEGPQELRVWESTGKRIVKSFPAVRFITSYEFSPDGSLLVAGDRSGAVRVLKLETGDLRRFEQYGEVATIRFSSDARYLATGDMSGVVIVWKFPEMNAITRLQHTGEVQEIAFSNGGDRIAVRTELEDYRFAEVDEEEREATRVLVSPVHTRDLLSEACARLVRFSPMVCR